MLFKILGLVVKNNPIIVFKSKQIIDMLDKFIISEWKKTVILTADIVSGYTNMPINNLVNIAY